MNLLWLANTASIMKKVDDILRPIPARGGVKKDNVSSIRAQLLDLLRSSTGATEGKVDTGGEDSAMEATVSPSGDADATDDVIPPVLLNTMTAMMYAIAQMGASVSELSNTMSSNSLSRLARPKAKPCIATSILYTFQTICTFCIRRNEV